MRRKLYRVLSLILGIVMLSGEMGEMVAFAAGDAGVEAVSENGAGSTGGESVSDNDTISDNEGNTTDPVSDNVAAPEDESVSDNSVSDNSVSDNSVSQNESASISDNDADEEPISNDEKPDKEYKLLDINYIEVNDISVTPGSYAADINVTIDYNSSANKNFTLYGLFVLFTDQNDADFFSDKRYVLQSELDNDPSYIYTATEKNYTGSSKRQYNLCTNAAKVLNPDTVYTYRIMASIWNQNTRNTEYFFITVPADFTTKTGIAESTVDFGSIETAAQGYYRSTLLVTVDNPDGDFYGDIEVVEKSENDEEAHVIDTLVYDEEKNAYTGYYYNDERDIELRLAKYTGRAERSYAKHDIEKFFYDDKDARFSVSFNEYDMSLAINGEYTPYHASDEMRIRLNYRKSTQSSYNSSYNNYLDDNGRFSKILTSGSIKENTEYDIWLDLGYINENASFVAVRHYGSESEPYKYMAKTIKLYTADDFADKGIYEYLMKRFSGGDITNDKLEAISSVSITANKDYVIEKLDDLAEKMPNLQNIYIRYHDITDISCLTKMNSLSDIDLLGNDISSLPDMSCVKWEKLNLNDNLIDISNVDTSKLPEGLDFTCSVRKEELNTAPVCYIDTQGIYPLIFEFFGGKDGRYYDLSISLNGIQKTYTDQKFKNKYIMISTVLDDFGVEKGKEYNAQIIINDKVKKIIEKEVNVSFVDVDAEADDRYASADTENVYVYLYIDYRYMNKTFKSLTIKKDGKNYYSYNGSSPSIGSSDMLSKIYGDYFDKPYYIDGLDYSMGYISTDLGRVRIPQAGDYDIELVLEDGEMILWPGKVHISTKPTITGVNHGETDFDNKGDCYYIRLYGYNLTADGVYPVITDEEQNEYTTLDTTKRSGNSSLIYMLKKNENWSKIDDADDNDIYYITLKGKDFADHSSDSAKTIKARDLKGTKESGLSPVNGVYNWRKERFEFRFDSSVASGTKLKIEFYDDSLRSEKKASGTAVVDRGGLACFTAYTEDTHKPFPEEIGIYKWYYLNISDGSITGQFSLYISWPDYRSFSGNYVARDYISLSTGRSYYAAPLSAISLYAYGTPKSHVTDDLYVRLAGTDETVALKCIKGENQDRFTCDEWIFRNALKCGEYTIELFEKLNGEEVILDTSTLYVKDPQIFYANVYKASFYADDPTAARANIQLSVIDVPDTEDADELKALVEKIGLKVEVFDADLKPVKDVEITPYLGRQSGGDIYFNIKGLDKDEFTYYLRYTMDGQTPKIPYSEEEYYKDPEHGEKFTRKGEVYFGTYNTSVSILCLAFYGDIDLCPVTVNFYPMTSPEKLVQSIIITKNMIKGNEYDFTKKDMKKIDPNTLYYCYVLSGDRIITSTYGYFESIDSNTAYYNPYWLSLKTGKHSLLTVALDVDKNGGVSDLPLYKMSKSAKSAKMNKLTKPGYTFKGWYLDYTDSKGRIKTKKVTTINRKFLKKYAPDNKLKLYAKYSINKYTVKYVKSAKYEKKTVKVSGGIKNTKYAYAADDGTINDIIIQGDESQIYVKDKRNLKLMGWTTVKNGSEVMYKAGDKISLEDLLPKKGKTIVLYAVYGPK